MTETPRPHSDMQKLSDSSADLYEAIATLEFTGRTVSRSQLAAATGLSSAAVAQNLRLLVDHDFVLERAGASEPVYVPARRGWSAMPSQATGKLLSPDREPGPGIAASAPAGGQGQTARWPGYAGGQPPGGATSSGSRPSSDDVAASRSAIPPVGWSDSGSVAVISWSTADGQVFRRETADQQEATRLTQSIIDDDQLALVSAQVRRVGIGPGS